MRGVGYWSVRDRAKRAARETSSKPSICTIALSLIVFLVPGVATLSHAAPGSEPSAATAAPTAALAKPTSAAAQAHLTAANRFYRLREFEKAIEEYKAGAVKEDKPIFHYNLGHSYRQLGRYEEAIWHYERFLERGKPTGEVEASVKDFIAQMKGELERKAMTQLPIEPAPISEPDEARSEANAFTPSPAEARREMPGRRKIAIAIGASGVAIVGLGLGLGFRARSFETDAHELCPMSSCERADEANALIDRGKTNALYANVALGVGAAAVVGTVVLWVTTSSPKRERTALMPQVSRSFAGIAMLTSF